MSRLGEQISEHVLKGIQDVPCKIVYGKGVTIPDGFEKKLLVEIRREWLNLKSHSGGAVLVNVYRTVYADVKKVYYCSVTDEENRHLGGVGVKGFREQLDGGDVYQRALDILENRIEHWKCETDTRYSEDTFEEGKFAVLEVFRHAVKQIEEMEK